MDRDPKVADMVKRLAKIFNRDLIAIPLIKKYPHQAFFQRCGLKAATLELDTSSYPNIDYIAGNRLSVYPINPPDHVSTVLKHLVDDIYKPQDANLHPAAKKMRLSEPWAEFIKAYGKDSLRLLLKYVYDITAAPSRQLLQIMAESCTSKEHKKRLLAICASDETWERWICQNPRTMKSTFEEFSTCTLLAKTLLSELGLQQPRQYTISSIKSSKRFRTEIVVFQHKFTLKQIASYLQNIKEHDKIQEQDQKSQQKTNQSGAQNRVANHIDHNDVEEQTSSNSVRSIRSVFAFNNTPITSQQVRKVPAYSGPLMSLYASSLLGHGKQVTSQLSATSVKSRSFDKARSGSSTERQFDGLCSNYLLNLNPNDYVICEFVENPRFTLKGNRERPIMMIGQDVGVVAFRAFWQQRTLEHDRAQVFYTLFKDLRPKRFGDMQLVYITGNRCRVEDLFRREINAVVTNKILSLATSINQNLLLTLLDLAGGVSNSGNNSAQTTVKITSKELIDLGDRMARLLVENNGCLYTCCDPQMTQAIEILIVESVIRRTKLPRENIMSLVPQWKGRRQDDPPDSDDKYLFKLENPFEGAQIVQEIYDFSM